MAVAFVDDSGSGGDSPYFVLAGFVASESTWVRFIADWQAVLDLSPKLDYFKMSEAESLKGQFASFTVDQRGLRLRQFIDVILKHNPWEVSIAVPEKDYNEVLRPVLPKSRANPYYSAFIAMVTACSGLYRWSGSDEIVDFVFDEQDGIRTKATRQYFLFRTWYPNWRLGRVAFENDRKLLPLQAADLVAWQTRRFMCSKEGTRKEFKQLHSQQPPFRQIVKRRLLQEMTDAIRDNIPILRQEYGDKEIDKFLAAIQRRNQGDGATD